MPPSDADLRRPKPKASTLRQSASASTIADDPEPDPKPPAFEKERERGGRASRGLSVPESEKRLKKEARRRLALGDGLHGEQNGRRALEFGVVLLEEGEVVRRPLRDGHTVNLEE